MVIIKASTRFKKWFYKTPINARSELVYQPYTNDPMSLNVIMIEVKNETKLGAKILKDLGFEDD